MDKFKIDDFVTGQYDKPFVIAEAGVNYYEIAQEKGISPLAAALLMVEEAAKAGADAIKFQIYKAHTLASKYSPAYWDTTKEKTQSQFELFQKYDKLEDGDYEKLAGHSRKHQIIFCATPFDEHAVRLIDKISPFFKIASADLTNFPMVKSIAKTGKAIILSTGAATMEEIKETVELIEQQGNNQIALLHCVLCYPTPLEDANLKRIKELKEAFPRYVIGYSDHTLPDSTMSVLSAAFLLGARIIEKHFTLNKKLPGNDHYHAMDSEDLRNFIRNVETIRKILGIDSKEPLTKEMNAIKYARRSLVAACDIKKGEIIAEKMLAIKRPGTGISPKDIDMAIGKKALRDIKEDEILTLNDLL